MFFIIVTAAKAITNNDSNADFLIMKVLKEYVMLPAMTQTTILAA